jgi:hypothetical protein
VFIQEPVKTFAKGVFLSFRVADVETHRVNALLLRQKGPTLHMRNFSPLCSPMTPGASPDDNQA